MRWERCVSRLLSRQLYFIFILLFEHYKLQYKDSSIVVKPLQLDHNVKKRNTDLSHNNLHPSNMTINERGECVSLGFDNIGLTLIK